MKHLVRIIILTLFVLLVGGAVPSFSDEQVVFNTKSLIYHCPSCQWAKKCTRNCITMTEDQAKQAGGRPCKICHGKCRPAYTPKSKEERRGCCSWHGGVCGCSMGRALCCDGTLSPTCGCD